MPSWRAEQRMAFLGAGVDRSKSHFPQRTIWIESPMQLRKTMSGFMMIVLLAFQSSMQRLMALFLVILASSN